MRESSPSCSAPGTCRRFTAAIASARSAAGRARSAVSRCATARGSSGRGGAGFWAPPQPARQREASAALAARLVRILLRGELERPLPHVLEVLLLDRDRPLAQLLELRVA